MLSPLEDINGIRVALEKAAALDEARNLELKRIRQNLDYFVAKIKETFPDVTAIKLEHGPETQRT